MDLVIDNRKWPPIGRTMALSQEKAPSAGKETTVTIVTTVRSLMTKMLHEGIPIASIARRLGVGACQEPCVGADQSSSSKRASKRALSWGRTEFQVAGTRRQRWFSRWSTSMPSFIQRISCEWK